MFDSTMIYKLMAIIIATILMVILGKADKKKKLTSGSKLVFQIIISLIIVCSGIKIEFLRNPAFDGGYIYLNFLSIPLSIIWLVSITNSIGQTDELGDITPYIVFIASSTFLAVVFLQRQGLILAEVLSLILIAISLIFIKYFPQRKFSSYYMSFGFILAIIAIVGVSKSTATLTLFIPLLILGVPLIDSSYSIVASYARQEQERENWEKYSLFSGSESKLRQKLQSYGFSFRGANITIISVSLYLSLSALIISLHQNFYLMLILTALGWLVFEGLKKKVQSEELIIKKDLSNGRIKLFEVGIDKIDNQIAIQRVEEFIESKRGKIKKSNIIITPDTLAILRARKDTEYLKVIKSADLVTPDGAGILWATNFLRYPLLERVTGIDIVKGACKLAVKKGYSLYLLGSLPGVAHEAGQKLISDYPGLKIVGSHHGYFANKEEEAESIKEIRKKRPDVLLVGMGVPIQEKWIARNLYRLNVPVSMGVGGSFDVLSGRIPRAPLWMQRHGMEWIYRLIKQPKRVFRVISLFYFIWLVFIGKIVYFLKTEAD